MKHLTGICFHCGKKKENHFCEGIVYGPEGWKFHGEREYCDHYDRRHEQPKPRIFHDSGQAALERHAPELFEVVSEMIMELEVTANILRRPEFTMKTHRYFKIKSIIDKIKQP